MKIQSVLLITVFSLFCCAAQPEILTWSPRDGKWKVGYYKEVPRQYVIHEFIREGDDINNWKELVTIQNFAETWGGTSPEDAYNGLKAIREKECPGTTKWNIINKNADTILYEWQSTSCAGWPDQYEIAKIFFGKYNRFVLRYTVKKYQMDPEERSKWIGILSEAKITTRLQ